MRSLECYIKNESRCVSDVAEARSIYRAKLEDPYSTEEDIGKWHNILSTSEMRLELARKQLKSYIENNILLT